MFRSAVMSWPDLEDVDDSRRARPATLRMRTGVPPGRRASGCRSTPLVRAAVERGVVGQARRAGRARAGRCTSPPGALHEGEGPGRRPAEGEPDRRPARPGPIRVAGDEPAERRRPAGRAGSTPGRLERAGDGQVEARSRARRARPARSRRSRRRAAQRTRRSSRASPVRCAGHAAVLEPVADPAQRSGSGRPPAELLAQVVDVGVDGVRRHRHAGRPDVVEQPVAGQRLARDGAGSTRASENSRGLSSTRVPSRGDLAARLVEGDRADLEPEPARTASAPAGAPGEGAQARRELLERERLDEVVVGARVEAGDPVVDGVARGEDEDRHASSPSARRSRATSSPEPSGRPTSRMIASMPPTSVASSSADADVDGELDDVPVLLEEAREEPAEPRVVLDDEQVHGRNATRPAGVALGRPAPAEPRPRSLGTTVTSDAAPRLNRPPGRYRAACPVPTAVAGATRTAAAAGHLDLDGAAARDVRGAGRRGRVVRGRAAQRDLDRLARWRA